MQLKDQSTILVSVIVLALVVTCGSADISGTLETSGPETTSTPPIADTTTIGAEWPSGRKYSEMVYDPASERLLVFGGYETYSPSPGLFDVWAYDPATNSWHEQGRLGPEEVRSAAMDVESKRVIVFGRGGPHRHGDTWAYDPAADTWQQMNPETGPTKRWASKMTYDAESDRIVFFGGGQSARFHLGDTWVYDYNTDTWTEMLPESSPPPRGYHGMVYNPESDRVLLWGGTTEKDVSDLGVWAYDYNSNTWAVQEPPSDAPEQRAGFGLFFHSPSGRMVVYGGLSEFDGEMVSDTTWAYDPGVNTWTALAPSNSPGTRAFFPMAYAAAVDKAILFSGELTNKFADDLGDDVWVFDPTANDWDSIVLPTDTPVNVSGEELLLTFDGESCTYEGPTELTAGPVELIFLNKSEAPAAVNFLMLLEGKTIQDVIEYHGEEPTSKHAPSWTRDLGTWRSVAAGESQNWEGDLEPASYFMVCARLSPLGVWLGTGLTVGE